ncbi:hypothetical protein MPOCJGCO_3123 [Methylobacterium trifolii]|uniref:Calx-beta domain-containing protein n=2 Tax=Methylobacterium trifolii TaxID=1003092 RepID=A0ABQ4U0L3_9HYPH|nr:hypothetical protein MPOCJGCO_3123 [Methylobacterium trifolii]
MVTRTGDAQSSESVTASAGIGGDTAIVGSDYTAASQVLSFAPGQTTATFTVATIDDGFYEGATPETVTATLSAATDGATISTTAGSATGTIADNEAAPTYALSGGTATEGQGLVFTITRSGPASQASESVSFSTSDGTATAGSDYTAITGQSVTFAAGQTRAFVTVATIDDALFEGAPPETVIGTISGPSAGTIGTATATGTISDNDPAPSFAISPATLAQAEGNTGTTSFVYTVTRTGDAHASETVAYAVTGSGTNPASTSDFAGNVLPSGTVAFTQGVTSQQIVIQVVGDMFPELNEDFTVTLSAPNFGTITTATATGTIISDDIGPPRPTGPTPGDDNLTGTDGPDSISLLSGNDTYSGGLGNDTAFGNEGDDLIQGNQGDDLLLGNMGNDTLYGGQGADTLYGGQNRDVLLGNQGSDVLFGNLGADTLYGGQGSDTLFGGQGNDVVYGDLGDDFLYGDLGDDVLTGGQGADRYDFNPASGHDVILGFAQGEGDRIDLRGQSYSFGTAADGSGSALLVLSGGGTIELAGITEGQVNASFFA